MTLLYAEAVKAQEKLLDEQLPIVDLTSLNVA
jgi:hypothetical protein